MSADSPFNRLALVASALLVFLASPAFAQEPEVTFSPTSGPPGTEVTAEGFGFAPGEELALLLGETTLATGVADDEGFARLTGTIPETSEPGAQSIHVQRADGSRITQPFDVTAPAESPREDQPQEGGQVEPGEEPSPRERAPAEDPATTEDGGFPWPVIALIALALLLVGGGILLAQQRVGRRFCPAQTSERIVVGTNIWAFASRDSGAWYDRPCVFRVWIGEKEAHYFMYANCRLPENHIGDHSYEDPPRRNPASEDEFFHEKVVRGTVIYYDHYDCKLTREQVADKALAEHGDPAEWPSISGLTFKV